MSSSSSSDTKKENDLRVGVNSLHLGDYTDSQASDSPPSLQQTWTLSTGENSATPKSLPATPTDQSIQNNNLSAEEREKRARSFIKDRCLQLYYDDLDEAGKLRAKRLMSEDFSWSPNQDKGGRRGETTFRDQFELLCATVDGWKDLSRVFFDEDAFDNYLVIRKQKADICYMHAVTVYQHYLNYLRSTKKKDKNHTMLDISWYIRNKFPTKELENFLKKGEGGSPITFLSEITGIGKHIVACSPISLVPKSVDELQFHQRIDIICQDFQNCREPALVSGFAIEESFKKEGVFKYEDEVNEKKFFDYGKKCGKPAGVRVLHSMVMLGLWKDDKMQGKVWFLLQNFWETKYLVVVSGEYLSSCGAKITFLPKSLGPIDLVDKLEVVDAHYAETETSPEEEEYNPEEEW